MNNLTMSQTSVRVAASYQQTQTSNQIQVFPRSFSSGKVIHTASFQRARNSRNSTTLTVCSDSTQNSAIHQKTSKVKVVLGDYKNGAIKVNIAGKTVSEEEVDALYKKQSEATYKLKRINFTSGGAKIGHTVKINFEGVYVDGPKSGQGIPGTKAKMFELDLVEGKPLPWSAFVSNIVAQGMGQEESKSFVASFPEDYAAKAMRGVSARFNITVKEISKKEELETDSRSEKEQRAAILESLQADAKRVMDKQADEAIRAVLEKTSTADTQKVADSVSWAKFGPKSMAEFTWNLIVEEVSMVEGIKFDEVNAFLRSHAIIDVGEIPSENEEVSEEISFT
mmetsp:Transcript_3259/g.4437  ORF Transcript_3259/g.4437 Transcript_3259/m.4437 type:complete len:338 (-) Transcript_3259:242-1255(-)